MSIASPNKNTNPQTGNPQAPDGSKQQNMTISAIIIQHIGHKTVTAVAFGLDFKTGCVPGRHSNVSNLRIESLSATTPPCGHQRSWCYTHSTEGNWDQIRPKFPSVEGWHAVPGWLHHPRDPSCPKPPHHPMSFRANAKNPRTIVTRQTCVQTTACGFFASSE
jgi:hypothetical protein